MGYDVPITIDHLTASDVFSDGDHPGTIAHESLHHRLQQLQAPGVLNQDQVDALIDQLIDRRWLMPLTIWRCPAADGWPSPMTVYRRGPDCPDTALPPPVRA